MGRQKSDILVAVSFVFVILIMIVPLTPFLVDVLLTLSICVSLLVLFIAMYIKNPLDFSVFPSLLLIVTLYRLSLNIATTRLILLRGDMGPDSAGRIIKAFGSFIIGGNYVVGAIVFLILVVINFVVITKGAGRIAEVAARFTLDAMPGKQMSIDADLNAGLIDEKEARIRRERIEREADFYGAMDGASKFVRGDAIAGIIIIFINIVGGLIIGVLQKGMPIESALSVYTILTIGDGLVSQIPALITSTAAGIIVTRAASESDLGKEVVSQLFTQPRAIFLASAVILLLGLFPGIPLTPFFILSLLTVGAGYAMKRAKEKEVSSQIVKQKEERFPESKDFVQPVELLELELGYGLIPLVDPEQNGELLEKIKGIRRQIAFELGVVIPPMKVRDNLHLKSGEYVILIRGIEVGRGELLLGHLLAMSQDEEKRIPDGIPTKEPVFNLDAYWIKEKDRDKYVSEGMTVVDHSTIVATHLTEVVRTNAHEFLTRQETQKLLDSISHIHQKVVEELAQNNVSVGLIQKVLQNLLREEVSIRDLVTILEAIADITPNTKDPEAITEYVRQRMARSILKPYLREGTLSVLIFERGIEEKLISSLRTTEQGSFLALDLNFTQVLVERISEEAKKAMLKNLHPVILVHPSIRAKLKRFLERYVQGMAVISHNEVPPQIKIHVIGVIRTDEN